MTKEEFHNWALEHGLSYDLCENEESYTLTRDNSPESVLNINIDVNNKSSHHWFNVYYEINQIPKYYYNNLFEFNSIVYKLNEFFETYNINLN